MHIHEAVIVLKLTTNLFTLTATNGGATDDFFQMVPVTLTFSVGAVENDTADVSVMILNDDFVEGDETFDLSISSVMSSASASSGMSNRSTITITDNDSEYQYSFDCRHIFEHV